MEFHITQERNVSEHEIPLLLEIPWHFTASAVVIASEQILLVHHKRIGAWLPPGGHLSALQLPHQAAVRETLEETGVAVRVLSSDAMPLTGEQDAFFLPQPLCQHAVKAVEKGNELYHVDIAYLCVPVLNGDDLPAVVAAQEVHGARWIALSALPQMVLAKNVPEIVALALSRLALL